MKRRCPHANIVHCPLYHAAHYGDVVGLSCDDGRLETGFCATARKLDYARAVARLEAVRPDIVARCRFNEEAAEAAAQRRRNMRAAGLH